MIGAQQVVDIALDAAARLGRADETEAHILEALRLSPRDTWKYLWCTIAGWAKLHAGHDEEAAVLRDQDENCRSVAPPGTP